MKKVVHILIFFLLYGCSASTGLTDGGVHTDNRYKLIIYYGTPLGVDEIWDVRDAAKVFSSYDYIVFGADLVVRDNIHHYPTRSVISEIHSLNKDALIFGYVDLDESRQTYTSHSELRQLFLTWKDMGVDGIFLDDAGYDYDVPRSRLNSAVAEIHALEMPVFVNAWNPDDIFSRKVDKQFNPNAEPTYLGKGDYYLLENFLLDPRTNSANSHFSHDFLTKMKKALKYREQLGVKLMSVSAIDHSTLSTAEMEHFFSMNEAAAGIFSLDGYGIAPIEYSSSEIDFDVILPTPYMKNYKKYYSLQPKYEVSEDMRKYRRGKFSVVSRAEKKGFTIPK